jgi:alpha-galactosidase
MIETSQYTIDVLTKGHDLWRLTAAGRSQTFAAPTFEIDGEPVTCRLTQASQVAQPQRIFGEVIEHRYIGNVIEHPHLRLELVFRVADASPVVRFRYVLHSDRPAALTKTAGRDVLQYLATPLPERQAPAADAPRVTEVRLSEFFDTVHSYCPTEHAVDERHFEHAQALMGPILLAGDGESTLLLAYEHGSQVPDAFVHYQLAPDRTVTLAAVKGNYYAGQPIGPGAPYQTIWLDAALTAGDQDAAASAFRRFVLAHMSPNAESRRPYIFYNT